MGNPFNTDRSAFLAATPALALLTAGPAALAHTQSSDIDQAIANYREAAGRSSAFDHTVLGPIYEQWQALCKAIPHYTTKAGYEAEAGEIKHFRTDREIDVAVAQSFIREPYATGGDDFSECVAELAKAVEDRNAQFSALRRAYRIDEVEAESYRLTDVADAALIVVENYPVRTLAELIKKAEVIEETEGAIPPEMLLADLRRIAGSAAHAA